MRGAALVSVALLAAACGSSSKHSSSTSSGGSSAGVAHASAVVASLSKPTTTFAPPGPPLKNVNSLKGKSVWYIPISLSAPVFAVGNTALHTALGKAGVTVHACSGEANPSATAACINQAVDLFQGFCGARGASFHAIAGDPRRGALRAVDTRQDPG